MVNRPESCCGYTFQTANIFSGGFQLIISAVLIAVSIDRASSSTNLESIIPSAAVGTIQIFQIVLVFFLFEGARERILRRCKVWFYGTAIITVATFGCLLYEFYEDSSISMKALGVFHILSSISIIANIVFIGGGFLLMSQLAEEDGEGGTVYNME